MDARKVNNILLFVIAVCLLTIVFDRRIDAPMSAAHAMPISAGTLVLRCYKSFEGLQGCEATPALRVDKSGNFIASR